MDNLEFLDRIKRLVIIAMFSDDDLMERFVLKGGNLVDIVYGVSVRSSVDIDLSMDGEFAELEVVREKVATSLAATFGEAGYVAFDVKLEDVLPHVSEDLRAFWGGYRIQFKIIERERYEELKDNMDALRRNAASVGKRASTVFKVDISKHEYCSGKKPHLLEGYTIYAYTPEMLVCEKLRAICQQMPEYVALVHSHPSARARDFVDIHTVTEHFSIDFTSGSFLDLLRAVFDVKRVPLALICSIGEFREYHRHDFAAVRDTVKPDAHLEEFDFYFDYVVDKCRDLETLWDE